MRRRGWLPTPRQLAWLLMREAEALPPAEAGVLARIRADAEVEATYRLAHAFVVMVQERRAGELDGWLAACGASRTGGLVSFATGLRQNYVAVRAALELPRSNGQAEGQINRLETLKQQMYGRAGFELLRRRVPQTA